MLEDYVESSKSLSSVAVTNSENLFPNYQFCPGIFLVRGAKRGAVYDTNLGKVYSLNEESIQAIDTQEKDKDFWDNLEKMGLVTLNLEHQIPHNTDNLDNYRQSLNFAWLEITDQCNEKCVHCYGSFSENSKTRKNKHLSFYEWQETIMALKDNGCNSIQFIGGEPLLYHDHHKNVLDLIDYAYSRNFREIELFTNGTLLNSRNISRIKDTGVKIAVSLYSFQETVHDAITQRPGSCKKTLEAIQLLLDMGVPIRIATIVSKFNEDTLGETRKKLLEMGIITSRSDIVRPSGRALLMDIEPSQQYLKQTGMISRPLFSTDLMSFSRNHDYHSCLAGKIAIDSEGSVMPCVFIRNYEIGNLRNQKMEDLLSSQEVDNIWRLTKDKILVCKDCEYRYVCSDCRSIVQVEALSANYLEAPYSRCNYNPYSGEWGEGTWKINSAGIPEYINIQTERG